MENFCRWSRSRQSWALRGWNSYIKFKTRDQSLYAGADTGFIGQNVYLFCASEGLATVVRASVDRKALAVALKLSEQKRITLAQTVGYPPARGR